MTTDNTDLTDEISQEQETLDQEQGITADTTVEVSSQQLLAEIEALKAANRGLQSKVDTGINAVRRDTKAWAEQQIQLELERIKGDWENQQYLASLDEDQQVLVKGMQQYIDKRIPQPTQTVQSEATVDNQQALVQQWAPVVEYVETLGISRSDPRVQYTLLAAPDSTVDQNKWNVFRDHLVQLRVQDLGAPASNAPVSPPASNNAPQTANPPIEDRGQVANLNSVDDVRDAYIAGRFSTSEDPSGTEEYRRRMASLGESV